MPFTILRACCVPHPACVFSAAGWSTLDPDDAEVLANMKLYLRSLLGLSSTAQTHQQRQQQPAAGTSQVPDSQGWSRTQRALVGAQAADCGTYGRRTWHVRCRVSV
jgi:hypothetical protein